MEQFTLYFLLFIIYSFLGWLLEVVEKLVEYKRFINRGFLIGPICPIYGYGVLGVMFLIGPDKSDVLGVFLKSILICAVLEYSTSYLMEKLFKARWWDYSQRKFNINGRICLEMLIPFGLLSLLMVYIVNPLLAKLINLIPYGLRVALTIIFLIGYLVDNIFSFVVMNKIKGEIKKQSKDNTEVIREHIVKWIEKNSLVYRHIKNAFPKFSISLKKSKN